MIGRTMAVDDQSEIAAKFYQLLAMQIEHLEVSCSRGMVQQQRMNGY